LRTIELDSTWNYVDPASVSPYLRKEMKGTALRGLEGVLELAPDRWAHLLGNLVYAWVVPK
jgi:hypothetical protein